MTWLLVLAVGIPLFMLAWLFVWSLCRIAALSDRAAQRQMRRNDD